MNTALCHCWCCERGKCEPGSCNPEECGKSCCSCVVCDGMSEMPYDHKNITACYCKPVWEGGKHGAMPPTE